MYFTYDSALVDYVSLNTEVATQALAEGLDVSPEAVYERQKRADQAATDAKLSDTKGELFEQPNVAVEATVSEAPIDVNTEEAKSDLDTSVQAPQIETAAGAEVSEDGDQALPFMPSPQGDIAFLIVKLRCAMENLCFSAVGCSGPRGHGVRANCRAHRVLAG